MVLFVIFVIIKLQNNPPIIPILGFHGIIDTKIPASQFAKASLHYPKKDLEKLIEYFIVHNYWFLTSQELYDFFLKKSEKIPEEHLRQKPILISFDDGYKTVHTNLLPILYKLEEKYGSKVKVVLFINPGTLAREGSIDSTHLRCEELREGLEAGFYDIQSHGKNHKKLTNLATTRLVQELLEAQTELRECTKDLDPEHQVASHLAYPYGAYNKLVKFYASKYYLSGYMYNNEILSYENLTDNYEIPRLRINRQTSVGELIEIVESAY
jgi:peptidoglycan/xylan/chitin deacetylase (PgdA/CDA1 family)